VSLIMPPFAPAIAVLAISIRIDAVAPDDVTRERGSDQSFMNAVQRSSM
jgi:hypothetical protein